jgi:hypothetical protein
MSAAHPGLRLAAFGVAGVALAWQIVTINIAPHLAGVSPKTALALAPHEPAALIVIAERVVQSMDAGAAVSTAERARARRAAEEAAAQAPLRAAPLLLMGRLAPQDRAQRFMEAAAQRSLTEVGALRFLLAQRIAQKRYAHAAQIADILLRSRIDLFDEAAPILERLAETEEGGPVVRRMIAENPPWRDVFLLKASDSASDARTPLRLLLAAREAPSARSQESARRYLQALFRAGHYDFAYEAWRRLLPKERTAAPGGFFNARLDEPLSASPFDWTIENGANASIDVVPAGEERALSVRYGQGRAAAHNVRQYVKLAPGVWRMSGRLRGALDGPRGLHWRIACADGSAVLGESEMAKGRYPAWTRFQFDFVVPETNCPLQSATLSLDARSPSEWIVSGEMLYAGLTLERIGAGLRAAQ